MEFNYAKKNIRNNFISGLLMEGIGLSTLIWSETTTIRFFWIFFGTVQLASAWFFSNNPYISIEDRKLTKQSLLRKTIEINKITKVWKYVNSYKIETADQSLTIDKNTMEPESLYRFTDFLNEMEIKEFGIESINKVGH